jgi:hypothetical protein
MSYNVILQRDVEIGIWQFEARRHLQLGRCAGVRDGSKLRLTELHYASRTRHRPRDPYVCGRASKPRSLVSKRAGAYVSAACSKHTAPHLGGGAFRDAGEIAAAGLEQEALKRHLQLIAQRHHEAAGIRSVR